MTLDAARIDLRKAFVGDGVCGAESRAQSRDNVFVRDKSDGAAGVADALAIDEMLRRRSTEAVTKYEPLRATMREQAEKAAQTAVKTGASGWKKKSPRCVKPTQMPINRGRRMMTRC